MSKLRFALAALALMVTGTACSPLDDAMVMVFGRSMRDQPSLDPYEQTLQPPEESVPFAAGNLTAGPYEFNIGQPERGADIPEVTNLQTGSFAAELDAIENPVPADETSLARGEEMYLRSCAVCHGEAGIGAEAYIVDVHPTVTAFNLSGPRVAGYSDGYIYGMIAAGRGLMPAYNHQISYFDRWHIVNYVRTLQRTAGNTPVIDQAGGN